MMLKVKWDTGGISDEPLKHVRVDEPEMVAAFYASKPSASVVGTPRKKRLKPRVEKQLQSPGRCSHNHAKFDTFVSEDDARYWNASQVYDNKVCDKCEGDSRPVSKKKPSYKCIDALTQGCLAICCNSCYARMICGSGESDK